MTSAKLQIRRVFDAPSPDDGLRILVDRLWPRGVRKEALLLDAWPKDLTPSNELRKAYHSADIDHAEFAARYRDELAAPAAQQALADLKAQLADAPATLLTAVKDFPDSHVPILIAALEA